MDYNFLLNQIKNLDTSITQYESNHASQDLVAFKELLAATKALIAEHAGKTRTVGTYQSGDFAKLKSVQRFAIAYKQATKQMESRIERVKAAQERDKVRFNDWWRPAGRTFPGDIPEGVMEDISTKRGEHTWNIVN